LGKYKCCYQTPYSEAYAGVLATPKNISHAGCDDSHILQKKPMHSADQTADKGPQPGLKQRKKWFKNNLTWFKKSIVHQLISMVTVIPV